MKRFTSKNQKIGELGEDIACRYFLSKEYSILERNYTKKYGEIDIIAIKNDKLHFIEVKTVSREINENVTHETKNDDLYRPEENMHPWKLKRLHRTIQAYLLDKSSSDNVEWQLDLACVFLDLKSKKAKVKIVNDIVI